jgi:hypothetical protein
MEVVAYLLFAIIANAIYRSAKEKGSTEPIEIAKWTLIVVIAGLLSAAGLKERGADRTEQGEIFGEVVMSLGAPLLAGAIKGRR